MISSDFISNNADFVDTRIWREAVSSGTFVQGVGDNSIAMTDLSVYLARKYFAEIFNITLDEVPEPDSAVSIRMLAGYANNVGRLY